MTGEQNLSKRGWKFYKPSLSAKNTQLAVKGNRKRGLITKVVRGKQRLKDSKYTVRYLYTRENPAKQKGISLYEQRRKQALKYPGTIGFSGARINPKSPSIQKEMKKDKISFRGGMFVLPKRKQK